jgi:hypothetical protein
MIGLGVAFAIIAVVNICGGLLCIVNPARGFVMGRRWQFDGPLPHPGGCALAVTRAIGVVGLVSGLIFGFWAVVVFVAPN